jgi:hypothetical protein
MNFDRFIPQTYLDNLFKGWGGSGQIQGNSQNQTQNTGLGSFGVGSANVFGSNPGGNDPTQWQGRSTSRTGNLGLTSDFATGIDNGTASTQTQQAVMDTPKAKAVSQWVVNDLKPTADGKAMADVTQVLDVKSADGSTTQIGKNRQITFEGKPVVKTPSNVSWSSTSFKSVYNSNTGMSLDYNNQDSSGNSTDLGTRVYREGDTWVNDTSGTRITPDGVSTLDGLGAYSPSQPGTRFTDAGLSSWLGQQWGQINSWSDNGTLVQAA